MDETMQEGRTADQLLVSLRQTYVQYEADYRSLRQGGGLFGSLRGYFSGNSASNDPIHREFIERVGQLTRELAGELAHTEEPGQWADQAADILLVFPSGKSGDAAEWSKMAAETMLEPLLPYLSRPRLEQALRDFRVAYRRMLPNQEKLAKKMEAELSRR